MNQELVSTSAFLPAPRPVEGLRHESVEQSLYVLFRRKWIIAGLVVAFTAAAAVAVWNRPPVRRAVSKLLIKQDRMSLQISELSPQSAKVPYSAQVMKSELELIKSRDVLLPIARQLAPHPQGEEIPPAVLEATLDSVSKSLVATAVGDTSVIQLEYFSSTAEEAERILGMVVDRYLEQHAMAYSGSSQLLAFYQKERDRAGKELEAAEERLREWQHKNNVISIDEQISGRLAQLSAQQAALQQTEAGGNVAVQENPLLNRIQEELVTAEIQLNDLLARYTTEDRRVREKKAQIAMIQGQLASVRRKLLASRTEQRGALERQIQETNAVLENLRERKLEGERLARVLQQHRDAYGLYGKKLEEARIALQLGREQLSNVAVIERPHATTWTDSDERTGTVVLASVVGLTLGVVLAFGLAFFNRSLRTRQDIEGHLGLPVLATIPDLRVAGIPDLRGGQR